MLLVEIIGYLMRRIDRRPVFLSTFVDHSGHHSSIHVGPVVTIVIPTKDKIKLLRACIESIIERTSYANYEILVVDNQSIELETQAYLDALVSEKIRVLRYPHPFNFSKILNFASREAAGEIFCFLNNDTEVIESDWLAHLVDHAIFPEIGVVGALLRYPSGTIQHAGIALGYSGVAGHPFAGSREISLPRSSCFEVSAVTFACAIVTRLNFEKLSGLDEKLPVGLNDVDFGARSSIAGLHNIVCTRANLIHHESQTRRRMQSVLGAVRAFRDVLYFAKKHKTLVRSDPFFKQ